LDGTNVSIEDLAGKENIELYGCTENGCIVPTVAKRVFKTREVSTYIKVHLDNGEVVKCTPNHRFMLRDGSYKEAQYLQEEDSLMPLYYIRQAMKIFGGRKVAVKRRLIKMGLNVPNSTHNHKVVLIEKVSCDSIPVYDIEVPLTNNFALSAGIFVHNSKDVADAMAGAVHNALQTTFAENSIEQIPH
jgi:intein/homing endonuclease